MAAAYSRGWSIISRWRRDALAQSDIAVTSNEPAITPELIAEHGLKPEEYERILKLLGRPPSFTELGIFSAMWNEHCSYKSSKIHLRTLPTRAPWVIQGPGENAGVIDIGDGLAVVFKMESHNHPSYIEPYQGAATGVGGILRDVFTMGARPIACLNALSFGDPDHPKTRHLVSGVVAGIGDPSAPPAGAPESPAAPAAQSRSGEAEVARVKDRAVRERYTLMSEPVSGIDLPVGPVNLRKARARPVADEAELVAGRGTVAFEIDHSVAVRLATLEHDRVVAAPSVDRVGAAAAIQRVVAVAAADLVVQGVAGDRVVEAVPDAGDGAGIENQVFDIGRQIIERHVLLDRVDAFVRILQHDIARIVVADALIDDVTIVAGPA